MKKPLLVLVAPLLLIPFPLAAASARLQGVGIDERLAGEPILAPALDTPLPGLPLWVRLIVGRSDLESSESFERLDARLEVYRAKAVSVIVTLADLPSAPEQTEPWRALLQSIASRYRGKVQAYQIGEIANPPEGLSPREYAYFLKLAAIQIRAADPEAQVLEGTLREGDAAWQEMLYREDVAAYVDGVAVPAPSAALAALVDREDPTASLLVTGVELGTRPEEASERLLTSQFRALSTRAALTTFIGEGPALARALSSAVAVQDLFSGDVVTLDDEASRLKLTSTGTVSHQLLYNLNRFSTHLALWGEPGMADVELAVASAGSPALRDPEGVAPERVQGFKRDEAAGVSRLAIALKGRPVVLDFSYGDDVFASRTDVAARASLRVEEIIFRHQQVQAAQDAVVENYQARARVEVHFRPPAADNSFDVVTDNNFYYDRRGAEWEELSFTFNGARWGSDRPAFPLLQPEKVLSLPLDLRLDRDYRYELQGVERLGEHNCYVVRFEPVTAAHSLYRGRVWIDDRTFARVKLHAVQTALAAPIVSNDEIQIFEPAREGVYLLGRLESKQLVLIAGRNLLVERKVSLSDYRINSPDFVERRAQSRSSENIMMRDTDRGLRYLVKRGGERVVSEELTRSAKALAMGVTVDPSFDFPLPIFGINYLDFDFLDRNMQLALLFGGVLALGNVQQTKALGTPLDVSVDFFGIAVPVNDQVFDQGGEIREERLRTIPFATGVNVGYQFTSFQKLTAGYQFRYDVFFADDRTAADFEPPVDTLTNAFSAGYEYRRRGYSLLATGTYNRRGAWEKWGAPATPFNPEARNYTKYSLTLAKDFHLRGFHKFHLDGAYFGGERLDRFSMFQFGLFSETKMHGVPSAGIRFGELALLHASYTFNLFDQYRLDLFFDQGFGRNPLAQGAPSDWERLTGVGVALNLRAPRKTILRLDVGKSFLPRLYSGSGSIVAQVLLLKPL